MRKLSVFILILSAISRSFTLPLYAWTDATVSTGTTMIRAIHINELRWTADDKRKDFGFSVYSWTDPTISTGTTVIRKTHFDEIRTALSDINIAFSTWCASVVPSTPTYTDSTLTAGTTRIKTNHVLELRAQADGIGTCASCCPVTVCKTGCNAVAGCTVLACGSQPAGCNFLNKCDCYGNCVSNTYQCPNCSPL
ncbi:MAG: hypothetical protein AABZ44_07510 [Elusimicrobiota bacterium]